MANYSLIVGSKYNPFSYQELLQPALMATQAHQDVENQYAELATKANVWEEMANEQTDPNTYKLYKTYANDLEKQAEQLAREGLNATSRRSMLNMRARYSKEITPIENAYTARQKQAEQQQQALLQDPTLLLSRRAATTSLDDYIKNPQLAYDSYSGKLLTAQVAQAASALAKEMRDKPRKWDSVLNGQYFETMMKKGYTPEEVLAASLNDPNSPKELRDIVEKAVASSGIASWEDQKLLEKAYEFARQGLSSAIGETQYQMMQNQEYLNPLQRLQKRQLETQLNPQLDTTKGFALNPSNIYSNRELTTEENKYKAALKDYSQYFYKKNGKWQMNEKGWKEYNRKVTNTTGKSMVTPEGTTILTNVKRTTNAKSPFRIFMDSLGMKGMSSSSFGSWQRDTAGAIFGKYKEATPESKTAKYDALKTSEYLYYVPQTDEYQKNFKAKVQQSIGSEEALYEVDFNPKTNQWEKTGNKLSLNDLSSKDYRLISRAPSEIGTTWFIGKEGEKAKRYSAIPGIHTTAEAGKDTALKNMLNVQKLLLNPNLNNTQRAKLSNYYDELTQQVHMFESQLDLVNNTEAQKPKPYYIP